MCVVGRVCWQCGEGWGSRRPRGRLCSESLRPSPCTSAGSRGWPQGTEAGRWEGLRLPLGFPQSRAQGSGGQLLAGEVQLAAGHPAVPG